jgi:uncharacterized phiE125 gp8 family phage protein
MQLKQITLNSAITEPITAAQLKTYLGYTATDQDTPIAQIITAARVWFENRTGLSVVSKSYKVYFDKEDRDEGWYELPVSPVLATPAITTTVNGVSTTFQQRGLNKVYVAPDNVIGTVGVGASATPYYSEVTFQAGESNEAANQCILEIAAAIFNNRDQGIGVNAARIPFDTLQRVNQMIVY